MDAERIFEAVGRLGRLSVIKDQFDKKKRQIASVSARKCGNCTHWMKYSCYPEEKLGQSKSMGSPGCKDFERCYFSTLDEAKFVEELRTIKGQLDALNGVAND